MKKQSFQLLLAVFAIAVQAAEYSSDAKVNEKLSRELFDPPAGENLSKVSDPSTCVDLATGLSREQKQKAVTMFQLSNAGYPNQKDNVPNGYRALSASEVRELVDTDYFTVDKDGFIAVGGGNRLVDAGEGFAARLYRNEEDGGLVLTFRGSERDNAAIFWRDWVETDVGQLLDGETKQYEAARKLLGDMLKRTAETGEHIDITSHSLGGGLTNWAMLFNNLEGRVSGWTVNAAGLSIASVGKIAENNPEQVRIVAENTINIRNESDLVSMPGNHVGIMYTVENEAWKGDVGASHDVQNTIDNILKTMDVDTTASRSPRMTLEEELSDIFPSFAHAEDILAQEHPFLTLTGAMISDIIQEKSDAIQEKFNASDHPFAQSVIDAVQDIISAVLPSDTAIDVAETLWEIGGCFGSDGSGSVSQELLDKLVNALPDGAGRAAAQALAQKIAGGLSGVSVSDIVALGTGAVQTAVEQALTAQGIPIAQAAQTAVQTAQQIASLVANPSAITGGGIVSAAGSAISSLGTTIGRKIGETIYNTIERTLGKDTADKWEKVWTDIKAGNDPWANGSIQAAAKQTAIVLVDKAIDKLGDLAWKRIEALAAKHPAVAAAMQALGINKQGLINAAKNIWGALTGPGSFADRLKNLAWQAAQGLAKMVKNLISWLGAKVAAWLNAQIGKIAAKIWAKILKWIAKLPTFGGRINYQKIYNALVGKLQGLVSKGVQAVVTPIATKVETATTNTAYKIIYGVP